MAAYILVVVFLVVGALYSIPTSDIKIVLGIIFVACGLGLVLTTAVVMFSLSVFNALVQPFKMLRDIFNFHKELQKFIAIFVVGTFIIIEATTIAIICYTEPEFFMFKILMTVMLLMWLYALWGTLRSLTPKPNKYDLLDKSEKAF